MAQVVEHKIWKIIELFYRSFLEYRRTYDQYKQHCAALRARGGAARETLRPAPAEMADLIDFQKLEELRDRHLFVLKDYCHDIFRNPNQTDPFDRYVSAIFHEVSILKEEHYTVKRYAQYSARPGPQDEFHVAMEAALSQIPHKMEHIRLLYDAARERLQTLLPGFRGQKILTRSLFLNRDGFVAQSHPRGIEGFYELMYPEHGPLAGFVEAGESFFESAFHLQAKEAFELGRAYQRAAPRDTAAATRFIALIEERLAAIEQALAAAREREETLRAPRRTSQ